MFWRLALVSRHCFFSTIGADLHERGPELPRDLKRARWEANDVLSPGKHTVVFDFKYDGLGYATLAFDNIIGIGHTGTGVLKIDGKSRRRSTARCHCFCRGMR